MRFILSAVCKRVFKSKDNNDKQIDIQERKKTHYGCRVICHTKLFFGYFSTHNQRRVIHIFLLLGFKYLNLLRMNSMNG